MVIEDAVDLLWHSTRQGAPPPTALQKALTLAEAYRVQLGVLARRQAAGEKLAGWKIGLSADGARKMFGLSSPISAYLLASRHFPSGHSFSYTAIGRPIIESELCFTLGKRLAGPGVTRAHVLPAVSAVAPAFEVVDMRVDMATDMPLGVADGVAQWGYVTGTAISPYLRQSLKETGGRRHSLPWGPSRLLSCRGDSPKPSDIGSGKRTKWGEDGRMKYDV